MIVIITGASSGIGFATAQALTEQGHTVYGVSRSCASAAAWEQLTADVTDVAALESAVGSVLKRHGRIDALIACAGIGLAAPSDRDLRPARCLFDVNFFGIAEMVRLCLPQMKQAGSGRIIVMSSMTGILPLPYQSFYSASKAALCAYAAALVAEARPFGVRVTAVLPGGVRTPFTKKRQRLPDLFYDPLYPGYEKAFLTISREEQTGMPAEHVAAAILHLLTQKKPPILKAVGGKYRLLIFVRRFLPDCVTQMLLRRKYGCDKKPNT